MQEDFQDALKASRNASCNKFGWEFSLEGAVSAPRTPECQHFRISLGDKNVLGEAEGAANRIMSLSFILDH